MLALDWENQRKPRLSFCSGLWICAILLYGLGDWVTTNLILVNGGRELNPVFETIVHAFGGDIVGSAIAKVVILGCLMGIYLFSSMKHRWAIPSLLSLVGAGLVVSNLISYLHP